MRDQPNYVPPVGSPLTVAERRVLAFMADGKTRLETAAALGVAISTVDTLSARARHRLDAANTTHAVRLAIRSGAIS
ncbi:MAG: Bacterial regulatory protein luxR family [Frankiales bacterium]|nr:Bacterial regulatory protein luxR family [Frankiales bacterium]